MSFTPITAYTWPRLNRAFFRLEANPEDAIRAASPSVLNKCLTARFAISPTVDFDGIGPGATHAARVLHPPHTSKSLSSYWKIMRGILVEA